MQISNLLVFLYEVICGLFKTLKYNYSANLNRLLKNIQLNGYVLKQLASCIEKKI